VYFIRKDRLINCSELDNEPTREILRLRQKNKQRLRSRGIKAVYIEMSFRSNYLKRRTSTGFLLLLLLSTDITTSSND
jgi:hypothetical protein